MEDNRFLDRAIKRAKELVSRPDLMQAVARRANAKAERVHGQIQAGYDDVQTLTRLVKAWARGQYRVIPLRSITAILGGLIYFLMPLDAVPDFVLAFGLLDDLAVIAMLMRTFHVDLDAFRGWEQGEKEGEATVSNAVQGEDHDRPA